VIRSIWVTTTRGQRTQNNRVSGTPPKKKAFSQEETKNGDVRHNHETTICSRINQKRIEFKLFPIPGIEPGALRLFLKAEYVLVDVSSDTFLNVMNVTYNPYTISDWIMKVLPYFSL
jgi:hypothetical protein